MNEMTGGSLGGLGLEVNDEGKGRGPRVKKFLLSSCKRPFQLSLFSTAGTRSAESLRHVSQSETAFTKCDSTKSNFVDNSMPPAGRMRASSLTCDASSQKSKNADSGNSSLIDSSSTDSYPVFSEGRSRNASTSKSDQNLTSFDRDVYMNGQTRDRHAGSSDKESVNASDVTEHSDDSISGISDDRDFIPQVYGRYDPKRICSMMPAHLCGVGTGAIRSHGKVHCSSFDGSRSCPNSYRDSGVVDTLTSQTQATENGSGMTASRVKKSYAKVTSVGKENVPLLSDPEQGDSTDKANYLGKVKPSHCKPHFRRSSSLGNIINTPVGRSETNEQHGGETAPVSAPQMPLPASHLYPKAAPTASHLSSHGHVSGTDVHNTNHQSPYNILNAFPTAVYPYGISQHPFSPMSYQMIAGNPYVPAYASDFLHSPKNAPHAPALHSHICSGPVCACRSSAIAVNQHQSPEPSESCDTVNITQNLQSAQGNPTDSTPKSSGIPRTDSPPGSDDSVSSHASSPDTNTCQNLESVLGYGAPVSASTSKSGHKPSSPSITAPLQVLVPRLKDAPPQPRDESVRSQKTTPAISVITPSSVPYPDPVIVQSQPDQPLLAFPFLAPESLPNQTSAMPHFHHLPSPQATGGQPLDSNPAFLNHPYPSFHQSMYSPHAVFLGHPNLPRESPSMASAQTQAGLSNLTWLRGDRGEVYMSNHALMPVVGPFHPGFPPLAHFPHHPDLFLPTDTGFANGAVTNMHHRGVNYESEPAFRHSSMVNKRDLKQESSSLVPECRLSSSPEGVPQGRYPHQTDPLDAQAPKPAPALSCVTVDFAPSPANKDASRDKKSPVCALGRLRRNKGLMLSSGDKDDQQCLQPLTEGLELNGEQEDEHGYQAGMVVSVPRSSFQPDFFCSHEELPGSGRDNIRESVPSSVGSGHMDNNNHDPLQRSNTSLLKGAFNLPRLLRYSISEIPDYRLLCLVAAIFNPLLGFVAYLCNRQARRNFQQQRHTRANNLYFATITISTVAIFFTLVGLALMAARIVVLNDQHLQESSEQSTLSCYNSLFGHDETLMNFFNMDLEFYCEVMKNDKLMNAMKHYRFLETRIKQNHTSMMSGKNSMTMDEPSNSSNADALTDDSVMEENEDVVPAPRTVLTTPSPTMRDTPKAHNGKGMQRNTVVSSKDGLVIPPSLESEYVAYLDGLTKTKAEPDGQLLPITSNDNPRQPAALSQDATLDNIAVDDTPAANDSHNSPVLTDIENTKNTTQWDQTHAPSMAGGGNSSIAYSTTQISDTGLSVGDINPAGKQNETLSGSTSESTA